MGRGGVLRGMAGCWPQLFSNTDYDYKGQSFLYFRHFNFKKEKNVSCLTFSSASPYAIGNIHRAEDVADSVERSPHVQGALSCVHRTM